MTSRKDAGKSLIDFTDDVGIPEWLITDGATEFTGVRIYQRGTLNANNATHIGTSKGARIKITRPREKSIC
jgi:hypothetical protein